MAMKIGVGGGSADRYFKIAIKHAPGHRMLTNLTSQSFLCAVGMSTLEELKATTIMIMKIVDGASTAAILKVI